MARKWIRNFSFFVEDMCNENFLSFQWVAERRVKRVQTQERGPPLVPSLNLFVCNILGITFDLFLLCGCDLALMPYKLIELMAPLVIVIVFARQFLVKQTWTELVFSLITKNIHKYELQKFVGHTNNKDDSV